MSGTQGRAPAAAKLTQVFEESGFESEWRRKAEFPRYEAMLPGRFTSADITSITRATGLLGSRNPLARNASANNNLVWILDNTAYQQESANGSLGPWEAEFVGCFFHKGRSDLTDVVSSIADAIGIDGKAGLDEDTTALIRSRAEPFIHAIAPARSLPVVIGQRQKLTLGPSNANGISSQIFQLDQGKDGDTVTVTSNHKIKDLPPAKGKIRFTAPEGWAIISDVDDTIKITQTPDPVGILQTTFAEPAKPTRYMPEFYKIINEQFKNPAWFYLSASPYNLYPFLHTFIKDTYPMGTLILRDASWQTFGGLLSSLTQGTQAYKTDRMSKIHDWLPKRKFICIGDSTQTDPESYAEMYKKYPGWVKAIYIRKVVDAPFMEQKNKEERFAKAFKDVPAHVWKVFELPDELKGHIEHLAGQHHIGMAGALKGFFCDHHQALKQDDRHQLKQHRKQ